MRFKAHSGLYEIVHEDGTPDDAGGVILINPFEVPAGEEERFLAAWESRSRAARALSADTSGRGCIAASAAASFRFVNIARWSSPLMFSRAGAAAPVQQAAPRRCLRRRSRALPGDLCD